STVHSRVRDTVETCLSPRAAWAEISTWSGSISKSPARAAATPRTSREIVRKARGRIIGRTGEPGTTRCAGREPPQPPPPLRSQPCPAESAGDPRFGRAGPTAAADRAAARQGGRRTRSSSSRRCRSRRTSGLRRALSSLLVPARKCRIRPLAPGRCDAGTRGVEILHGGRRTFVPERPRGHVGPLRQNVIMTDARMLAARLADLLRRERAEMVEFLLLLAEFDAQRGWLELGYSSLFYFLHRELGLSKGVAHYRKTAAELMQRFPEVIDPLRDGRLCITSIVHVAQVLTAENRHAVLPRFFQRSRSDARAVAAALQPSAAPHRDVVTVARLTPTPLVATTPRSTGQAMVAVQPA